MKRPNYPYLILSREHCSQALRTGSSPPFLSRLHEPDLGFGAPCAALGAPATCAAPGLRRRHSSLRRPCRRSYAAPGRTSPCAACPPRSVRCPSPCAAPVAAPCAAPVASVAWEFKRGLGDSDTAIQAWEAATQGGGGLGAVVRSWEQP